MGYHGRGLVGRRLPWSATSAVTLLRWADEHITALDKSRSLIRVSESTRTDFGRVNFADQNDAQKVFSSTWELESQVSNGGFGAYLRYSDSDRAAFAPTALRSVGATQSATAVRALQRLGDRALRFPAERA